MFCLKCGEANPDGSTVCSKCGESLTNDVCGKVVVYASQIDEIQSVVNETKNKGIKKPFVIVIVLSLLSFFFLSLNYMSVSIELMYYGSSDTNYSGYFLTQCLQGTARLSGLMVILLIVVNISTIVTAIIGLTGKFKKNRVLKSVILVEDVLYRISTIVPLLHIMKLLEEFDSSLSTTSVGMGCYLNIGIAVVMMIMYLSIFSRQLKD
ncbi:MAG: zinc ribbon domain-containing protein [Eubacteriales bacterium]|nr:zinc ribbon domain-containing protein [Eubacteriales bacterium]